MTKPDEELKEVTKLVLYGWGYPALFEKPNGDRFQNRLVIFPPDALPVIEGASQEALNGVQPNLKIVKKRYRKLLKEQSENLNPVWVWVDTPKQLSGQEILRYRQQFEQWVETVKGRGNWSDRLLSSILVQDSILHPSIHQFYHLFAPQQTKGWKRNAIVLVTLFTLMLVMMRVQS